MLLGLNSSGAFTWYNIHFFRTGERKVLYSFYNSFRLEAKDINDMKNWENAFAPALQWKCSVQGPSKDLQKTIRSKRSPVADDKTPCHSECLGSHVPSWEHAQGFILWPDLGIPQVFSPNDLQWFTCFLRQIPQPQSTPYLLGESLTIFWGSWSSTICTVDFRETRFARFPGALDAMAFREDQVAAAVTFLTHDRGLRGWIAEACAAEVGRDCECDKSINHTCTYFVPCTTTCTPYS